MRYLKVYEEFEPKDSVKEDIKDIFIELTDNYLDVQITDTGKIFITKPYESIINATNQLTDYNFDIDSYIIDSILRLIDYLRYNKLYLNDIIIEKLRRTTINGMPKWVIDNLYVSNITEEGLFIPVTSVTSRFIDKTGRYQNKLFSAPAHKIIIKYSDKNL